VKRLLVLALLAILPAGHLLADTKISALPPASTAVGTDLIPTVQGGNTVKQTVSGIDTYVKANGATAAVSVGGTGASSLTGVVHGNGSSPMTAGAVNLTTEVSGVLPVANGGTNLNASADDNIMVGNGTTWQTKAVPNCTDTGGNHLNYDTSTNTVSCGTSSSGGGGTPGGSNTQVQFNNSGAFGGDPDYTYDATNNIISLGNNSTPAVIQGTAAVSAGLTIRGGTSNGTNAGGSLTLRSGNGSSNAQAGTILVQPGTAGTGSAVAGANVTVQGGAGAAAGVGGDGGQAIITGGSGASPNGNAGQVAITGGTGTGSGSAGGVTISGGTPGSTGSAGPISITASDAGGSATAAGGTVSISSGAGVGTNQNGGTMTLKVGAATGTGTSNFIVQTNGANTRLSIDKNGVWTTPASTTSGTVFFGNGTSSPPAFQNLNGGNVSPMKGQRVTTGSITNGTSSVVTLTWTAAYADANYTATCTVQDSTAATASLSVVHIESVAAGSVGVRVQNTAASPVTGTLHCIAIHD
jgi:hypothetical protein